MKNIESVLDNLLERVYNLEKNAIPGLRDFFATASLSMLGNAELKGLTPANYADIAYSIADEMLKRRAQQ